MYVATKRKAFVGVGPPPSLVSLLEFLPTRKNMRSIGTVVGNIIATILMVQAAVNRDTAVKSSGSVGVPTIGPILRKLRAQAKSAKVPIPMLKASFSGSNAHGVCLTVIER